ncbi:DUF5924 family protein [Aliikangiella sp. IMCC44653]
MNAINVIKHKVSPLVTFCQKHQRLLAFISFMTGLASFFLVNRQSRSAEIIAAVILVGWLCLMLENLLTQKITRRLRIAIPENLFKFVTQLIHQESLFFVLPFFILTTTWNSGQAVVTISLIILALTSIIDPIYYQWLSKRRVLLMLFHGVTLFVVLLTVLPIVLQLSTYESYQYATLATLVLLFPTLYKLGTEKSKFSGTVIAVSVSVVLSVGVWYGRYWVPPASLWLTHFKVDSSLNEAEQHSPGIVKLTQQQLHQHGLYAYTAIRAPRGLVEDVTHQWFLDDVLVDSIPLKIAGGRKAGYRTWTHKNNFPKNSAGQWKIQVVTSSGQMIGLHRFSVD